MKRKKKNPAEGNKEINKPSAGNKEEFNKSITKGKQKIKSDELLIIVGTAGHRYYSITSSEQKGGNNE